MKRGLKGDLLSWMAAEAGSYLRDEVDVAF